MIIAVAVRGLPLAAAGTPGRKRRRTSGYPAVHLRRIRRVELAAEKVVAHADGERIGPLPLTIEVVPGAVRVLACGAGTPQH